MMNRNKIEGEELLIQKGDEVIHRKYGKCILLEEPNNEGECLVGFDRPVVSNVTELITHESMLNKS